VTGRRGAAAAVALLVVAGALAVVSAGRVWARATPRAATGTIVHVAVAGHHVAGALAPLGIALLAMSLAVVAARPVLRRVVGGVAALVGVGVVAVAVHGHNDLDTALARRAFAVAARSVHADTTVWWVLAVAAGVVAVAGGLVTVLGAGGWSGLGARYDAPSAPHPDVAATAWDALDRGEDPTA
jgi:uncharacterized membrane protein (TIGR02234 family)